MALRCWQAALVCSLAVGCFLNSLGASELVFDDLKAIAENPDVIGPSSSRLFRNDYWGHALQSAGSHGSYRPLTVLSFRWNYICHGLQPYGYHLVNVALHAAVSLLFLLFLWHRLLPQKPWSCTCAASLFAVLPVHCDAVASVVGRAELLSLLFVLSSLLAYHAACFLRGWAACLWTLLAGLSGGLAMLSKEQGVAAFPLCMALEALDFVSHACNGVPENTKHRRKSARGKRAKLAEASCSLLCMRLSTIAACAVCMLWARWTVAGGRAPQFAPELNPAAHHPDWAVRWRTFAYCASRHALMLFQLSDFSCHYSHESVPLLTSVYDPRLLTAAAVLLPFIALAISVTLRFARIFLQCIGCCISSSKSVAQLPAYDATLGRLWFSCMWLVIPFLPSSNVFVYTGFILAERVMYAPSAGAAALFGLTFDRIVSRSDWKLREKQASPRPSSIDAVSDTASGGSPSAKSMGVDALGVWLVIPLIGTCAAACVVRNEAWHDHSSLFREALRVHPENSEMNIALAAALTSQGQPSGVKEAIDLYERALAARGETQQPRLLYNIGLCHMQLGESELAESFYRQAAAYAPDSRMGTCSGGDPIDINARYNLGTLLINQLLSPTATLDSRTRLSRAREAADLFCEVLQRHGGSSHKECEAVAAMSCPDLLARLTDLRAKFDRDSRAVRDASGAVVARSLAHDQNRRMYMLALTTAQELVACRG